MLIGCNSHDVAHGIERYLEVALHTWLECRRHDNVDARWDFYLFGDSSTKVPRVAAICSGHCCIVKTGNGIGIGRQGELVGVSSKHVHTDTHLEFFGICDVGAPNILACDG